MDPHTPDANIYMLPTLAPMHAGDAYCAHWRMHITHHTMYINIMYIFKHAYNNA